jgi:hypothetical protein
MSSTIRVEPSIVVTGAPSVSFVAISVTRCCASASRLMRVIGPVR